MIGDDVVEYLLDDEKGGLSEVGLKNAKNVYISLSK